jgi:hypothetical protein
VTLEWIVWLTGGAPAAAGAKHGIYLADVNVDDWVDRAGYQPPSADLKGAIGQAMVRLVDSDGLIPVQPAVGMTLEFWDSGTIKFGGWASAPVLEVPGPLVPAWNLTAQSWAARMAEKPTGSLNKSGVLGTDRDFVIAMFTDALAAAAERFGSDTTGVDDPIFAANAAVGWSGVQATAFLYGTDWSYRTLLDVIQDLIDRVPGTSLRIRPDKIVEYGVFAEPADFALAAAGDANVMAAGDVAEIVAGSYREEILAAGHFNKVRLGGEGAAEETAYDQVSHGRFGRIMEAPYENDEAIPASDLRRAAYAKLERFGTRRVAHAVTHRDGIEPGMLVPVLVRDLGCLDDVGWSIQTSEFYLGTPLQEPCVGYRGELVVQKVTPTFVGPDVHAYELELGAYIPELERALAETVGTA